MRQNDNNHPPHNGIHSRGTTRVNSNYYKIVLTHKSLNHNPLITLYDSRNTVRKSSRITLPMSMLRKPVYPTCGASLLFAVIGIKENVAHVDVLVGQVPEVPETPGTVEQRQLNIHAVVVGIGEKAVLRKSVHTERNVKLA